MNVDIKVPILGESIIEGTLARWHKKIGDAINAGEVIADLETDKVNIEVSASSNGVVTALHKHEGDNVAVGELIASIDTSATAPSAPPAAVPNASDTPATPVARNVAANTGVDLRTVSGSGSDGRITKNDVIKASTLAPAAPVPVGVPAARVPVGVPPAAVAPSGSRREERVKMSRRRQTIATRLVQAQQTAAMLTTFNEIDLTRVMDIRKRKRDGFKEHNGVGLGFMSFFTKATVSALKAFPAVNAEIQGDEVLYKYYYDIGIAVSTPDGLVVPVLRNADDLSFAGIEKGIESLAKRARDNKLGLAELTGGTFTITNGGVFGSMMSTPILNMPQVGILGMHKIQERAMVMDGTIVIRPMMYIALSYDHRIIDGATAVRFLVHIKDMLEDPDSLLLEY